MRIQFFSPRIAALCAATTCILGTALPAQAWSPGKDGALTVTAANTLINTYTRLAAPASSGATVLQLQSTAGITVGDVLLVYQAQGASIATGNSAGYGQVTALGNAGRYELVSVSDVSGSTVILGQACGPAPLRFSYDATAQVVRVPQFSTLSVGAAGTVVARAWDGSTGGIAAALVQGAAQVDGAIHADAAGFRGGAVDNQSAAASAVTITYVSASALDSAEKGESIAGDATRYDALGGRYGRGAPANGGGGGNSHNSGGGGGANGGSLAGWNGQGVPDTTTVPAWTASWNLDPSLSATTNSPGGGRGGYTFSNQNLNALTTGPNNTAWGGNARREHGGLGGRPLANNPSTAGDTRLFFGGGGGAGDGNNTAAGAGGNGGGLVFVIAGSVTGNGRLSANGAAGFNTRPAHNDSPGGGGGGGSVVLIAPSAGGLSLSAAGGTGGNQLLTNNETEGPGGGGGGGFIAATGGTLSVAGGASGTTLSSSMTEFVVNGATRGNLGNSVGAPALTQVPVCTTSNVTDLVVSKTNTPASGVDDLPGDTVTSGMSVTYSVQVTNQGAGSVTGAIIRDTPDTATLDCPAANAVTCTSTASPSACPATPITIGDLAAGVALGTLPAAAAGNNTLTLSFTCTVR